MLPLELGGLVGHEFKVYDNVKGLQVVESSVPPLSMSQHLMTITYAMEELAANLIKAGCNGHSYALSVGTSSNTQGWLGP